jgi:hypothetical protein
MPKREIHVERKASAHEDEEMEERRKVEEKLIVYIYKFIYVPLPLSTDYP